MHDETLTDSSNIVEWMLARHARRRRGGRGVVTTLLCDPPAGLGPSVLAHADEPLDRAWHAWTHAARQAARTPALLSVARSTGRALEEVSAVLDRDDAEARSVVERAIGASSEPVARALRETLVPGSRDARTRSHDTRSKDLALPQALASIGAELPWLILENPSASRLVWALRLVETSPALPVLATIRSQALARIERELSTTYVDRFRQGLVTCGPEPSRASSASSATSAVYATSVGRHAPTLAGLEPTWRAAHAAASQTPADHARSLAERLLFEALATLPETRGAFRLNHRLAGVPFGPRDVEIDLAAPALRLALEVDGPFHFLDAAAYRRDRRKDALLQRSGFLVLRVLATDVVEQLEEVLDTVLENVRHARERDEG